MGKLIYNEPFIHLQLKNVFKYIIIINIYIH